MVKPFRKNLYLSNSHPFMGHICFRDLRGYNWACDFFVGFPSFRILRPRPRARRQDSSRSTCWVGSPQALRQATEVDWLPGLKKYRRWEVSANDSKWLGAKIRWLIARLSFLSILIHIKLATGVVCTSFQTNPQNKSSSCLMTGPIVQDIRSAAWQAMGLVWPVAGSAQHVAK